MPLGFHRDANGDRIVKIGDMPPPRPPRPKLTPEQLEAEHAWYASRLKK